VQKDSQPREGFKEGGFMVRVHCSVNNRQLCTDTAIDRSTARGELSPQHESGKQCLATAERWFGEQIHGRGQIKAKELAESESR